MDEETPKLFCLHFNECNPKRCTSIKLKRLNLLKIIKTIRGNLKKSIILTPFAKVEISFKDRKTISKYGLVVIDCSWKNILNHRKTNFENSRKLPQLIAANPTNYGKWEKLSSVEALVAGLFITKYHGLAGTLLSKFSWGLQFKELNKF